MMVHYFSLLICISGLQGLLCLFAPSYESPWAYVDTAKEIGLSLAFKHDFGVDPIKADVQVKSPTTGFIFPGTPTAQAQEYFGHRAGIICRYNATHAHLYAPKIEDASPHSLIFTGSSGWTSANQERSYSAEVRVRLWHPGDFPAPTFTYTFLADTANKENIRSIPHGGNDVPELTIVRGRCNPGDGLVFEAAGSNMQGVEAAPQSREYKGTVYHWGWGATVYGVNDVNVTVAVPVSSQGAVFSECFWGAGYQFPCMCTSADLEILVWHRLGAEVLHSQDVELGVGGAALVNNTFPTPQFNITTDFVTVTVRLNDSTSLWGRGSYQVPAAGAALSESSTDSAGLVYAYSAAGHQVRLWHPISPAAAIFRFGPHMEPADRKVVKITDVVVTINVWGVFNLLHVSGRPSSLCEGGLWNAPSTTTSTPTAATTTTYPSGALGKATTTTNPSGALGKATTSSVLGEALWCPTFASLATLPYDSYVCYLKNNMTTDEANRFALTIIINLTIDPKSTSKYIRTLNCAVDQRPSAKAIGMTGLTILLSYVLFLVAPDFAKLMQAIMHACRPSSPS